MGIRGAPIKSGPGSSSWIVVVNQVVALPLALSNKTHRSSTDLEALLTRKSNAHAAQLSYRGHVL